MQHLQYETVRRADWVTPILLIAAPIAALPIVFLVKIWWVNEPFMSLRFVDLAVFFGGPLALLVLAAVWLQVARRRRRLSWLLVIPVLCWFALNMYYAVQKLPVYFNEGWNW